MLDHLHILLNYQWDSRALLSVILAGLLELDDRLGLRRNRSLYSRLQRRLTIDGLSPEDTASTYACASPKSATTATFSPPAPPP